MGTHPIFESDFDCLTDLTLEMTKDKAAKYNGKWVQVKAENMDAVLAETGMGWTTRKVAGMMTVNLEVEARDNGMFTSLKTKLKNTDTLLLYDGVTKTKGLSDDEDVEITVSFDGDDNLQQVSKITKGGKTLTTNRSFKVVNNQLVLGQTCNGKTGARIFDRQKKKFPRKKKKKKKKKKS